MDKATVERNGQLATLVASDVVQPDVVWTRQCAVK